MISYVLHEYSSKSFIILISTVISPTPLCWSKKTYPVIYSVSISEFLFQWAHICNGFLSSFLYHFPPVWYCWALRSLLMSLRSSFTKSESCSGLKNSCNANQNMKNRFWRGFLHILASSNFVSRPMKYTPNYYEIIMFFWHISMTTQLFLRILILSMLFTIQLHFTLIV